MDITQRVVMGVDRYNGNLCKYFREFMTFDHDAARIIAQYATSREVKPNTENSSIALKKNDTKFIYPQDTDKTYIIALDYAWLELSKCLVQPPLSGVAEMSFAGDSSAGVIGLKTGFPKTRQFINSKPFDKYKSSIDYIPIKKINFKNEFLDIESDLSRKKIRLVDCEDKCFIYKQKFLYDNQNHALQEGCRENDIKYGMVKQYGGYSDFIIGFEECYLISCSDISGYDKCFVGIDVQRMRNRGLAISTKGIYHENNSLVRYVSYYTLNPVRLWIDGELLLQDHSNSSGQNNTTTDNCLEHVIIKNDLALTCFYFVYGRYPLDYKEFRNSFRCGIYSDDKVFGLRYPMEVCDFIKIEREVYLKYGMVIKETASHTIEHEPGTRFSESDAIEFLGGTAVWCDRADGYLPRPRLGKLMTSLTRRLDDEPDLSILEQYNKVYSIYELLLCVPFEIKQSVCSYLLYLRSQYGESLDCYLSPSDKRGRVDHLLKMVSDDLANAGEILGWESI